MWLALALYSTDQALTYTEKARKSKMYAGKNSIARLRNHPWWHHFTYGGIHQLLVMHFAQSSSNWGQRDFPGLWTGACMARTGSAEKKRAGMRGTKESERKKMTKTRCSLWNPLDLGREWAILEQTEVDGLDFSMVGMETGKRSICSEQGLRINLCCFCSNLWMLTNKSYPRQAFSNENKQAPLSAASLPQQDTPSCLPFRPVPNEFQAAFFEQTRCPSAPRWCALNISHFLLEEQHKPAHWHFYLVHLR